MNSSVETGFGSPETKQIIVPLSQMKTMAPWDDRNTIPLRSRNTGARKLSPEPEP